MMCVLRPLLGVSWGNFFRGIELPRYTDISHLRIVGLAGSPLFPAKEEPARRPAKEHFQIRTDLNE